MTSHKSAARTVGVLMLMQMPIAPVVNFALLGPATAPPGFLANAAAHCAQVTTAVLLLLVGGAISLGIAVTAFPVIRQYSRPMALWYLALAVTGVAGLLAEGLALRSMLSLSQQYVGANPANAAALEALGPWVRSVWTSAHFTNFLLAGAAGLVLYGALFRFALVPRALAAFGVLTVLLLIAGALIPLFGRPTVMLLFMPMGLSELALMLWLLVRGFREGTPAPAAEVRRAQLSMA
ncbi:MAG TPA: DUF4386 domain-containing protein [Longimicrobium sp.]|nr:DUF4386 domain-containing protein [Longimicrobium sp.]